MFGNNVEDVIGTELTQEILEDEQNNFQTTADTFNIGLKMAATSLDPTTKDLDKNMNCARRVNGQPRRAGGGGSGSISCGSSADDSLSSGCRSINPFELLDLQQPNICSKNNNVPDIVVMAASPSSSGCANVKETSFIL